MAALGIQFEIYPGHAGLFKLLGGPLHALAIGANGILLPGNKQHRQSLLHLI